MSGYGIIKWVWFIKYNKKYKQWIKYKSIIKFNTYRMTQNYVGTIHKVFYNEQYDYWRYDLMKVMIRFMDHRVIALRCANLYRIRTGNLVCNARIRKNWFQCDLMCFLYKLGIYNDYFIKKCFYKRANWYIKPTFV